MLPLDVWTPCTDDMIRIDRMHHCHKDAVLLLDSEVVNFTIKVIVKGRTCVLRLLIVSSMFT
jgi:hypothetical protein